MGTEIAKQDDNGVSVPDYLRETLGDEYESSVQENVEGERGALPVIKVLHGAELYKMPDGSKVDKFEAVIAYKHPARGYYKDKEDKSKKPPTCFSNDGKTGSLPRDEKTGEYGDCKSCALSQLIKTEDGKYKASPCAEKRRHLLIVGDSLVPYVLMGSVKSLNAIRDYMVLLTSKAVPYFAVKTEFKLSPGRRGQQEWSEFVLTNKGFLSKEELVRVKGIRSKIEERVHATKVSLADEDERSEPAENVAPPDDF